MCEYRDTFPSGHEPASGRTRFAAFFATTLSFAPRRVACMQQGATCMEKHERLIPKLGKMRLTRGRIERNATKLRLTRVPCTHQTKGAENALGTKIDLKKK